MPKEDNTKDIIDIIKGVTSGIQTLIIANFVINLVLSIGLQHLWSIIETQQLFAMYGLFSAKLPFNALVFFGQLMYLAAFDLYDTNQFWHDSLGLTPTDAHNGKFLQMGFSSLYFLNNMGTLLWLPALYLALLLVNLVSSKMSKVRPESDTWRKVACWSTRCVQWNTLITIVKESFLVIILCVFISLPQLSLASVGLSVQSAASLVFAGLAFALPTMVLNTLTKDFKNIRKPSMMDKFGSFYADLKLKDSTRKILLWPAFFFARRLVISIMVLQTDMHITWQLGITMALIAVSCYLIGSTDAHKSVFHRRLEVFNEICLSLALYTLLCFSPWIEEANAKIAIAYVLIAIIGLHCVVNLTVALKHTISEIRRKGRNWTVLRAYMKIREASLILLNKRHEIVADRLRKTKKGVSQGSSLQDSPRSSDMNGSNALRQLSIVEEEFTPRQPEIAVQKHDESHQSVDSIVGLGAAVNGLIDGLPAPVVDLDESDIHENDKKFFNSGVKNYGYNAVGDLDQSMGAMGASVTPAKMNQTSQPENEGQNWFDIGTKNAQSAEEKASQKSTESRRLHAIQASIEMQDLSKKEGPLSVAGAILVAGSDSVEAKHKHVNLLHPAHHTANGFNNPASESKHGSSAADSVAEHFDKTEQDLAALKKQLQESSFDTLSNEVQQVQQTEQRRDALQKQSTRVLDKLDNMLNKF
jgi:hypothetical protein